ncbi:hypothetical protein [Methanohalobium sp.]|uniref:hypothetical protein n=1 Tax=Methanohalobium sp. TaxID=2837493 RepID=UPI0025F2D587|nr:hypothetical protein [Methanohalobium sp.]
MIETQYGPAVSFAVAKVVETNDCDEELDNVLQTAEDSEDGLTLLTSSRRLLGMLDQCKQDSGTLEGNTYQITRFGIEENTQFQIEQQ